MKLSDRLDRLELVVTDHLKESGEIRERLATLSKAYWTLAAAGLTFNVSLIVGIILFLVKRG